MIIPEQYRGATLEGFYDPTFDDDGYPVAMAYTVYVTHPWVQAIASFTADKLADALDLARTAVDELIESWN